MYKRQIHEFAEDLELLVEKKRKVVIITDEDAAFPGTSVYLTGDKGNQIGVIVDSKYALSGEYGGGNTNTCLYSGQKNFVELFKNALANEIRLIRIGQESLETVSYTHLDVYKRQVRHSAKTLHLSATYL